MKMGFRKELVTEENENSILDAIDLRQPIRKVSSTKISLPSLKFGAMITAELAVGLILIAIGISGAGSYYGTPAEKFGGVLAVVFYNYQIGTVLIIAGVVAVYDGIKGILE